MGVRSLSRPNLVPAKFVRPHSAAWQPSLVTNLSSITPRRMPAVGEEARVVARHYCVAVTTLARNLIWPYNSSVLSCCTSSFLISTFLRLEAYEAQVELVLLLFGRIGQGLHSPANHLVHIIGHHRGPLGFLHKCSLGCDNHSCLALHQLDDHKISNGRERHNVLDGLFHLGQQCVNK